VRKFVAIAYLAGSTFGVLAIGVILLGCCVLPFHDRLHRIPLCRTIAAVLSGDHHDREQPAEPAQPAPTKRSPDLAAVDFVSNPIVVAADRCSARASLATHQDPGARNVVTLGALRVDDDVGLNALFSTFRI
jgi:hypothetical protein